MLRNLLIGSTIIVLTCLIHSGLTQWISVLVRKGIDKKRYKRLLLIDVVVLIIIFVSLIEATVWAAYYFSAATFASIEEALYFSVVTFTTLGYGDVTLPVGHRLLGALEAANGIILFGWSTALVISAIQKLHFGSAR
ncbi:MAG TPA: potassium channel family protein [Cyclobacteriaceae bacterium]|nr:potassium channel family protein [Cyclobacteriaceae bacterium]